MSEFSQLERDFLYYTECALATVDSMPKSWSKSQRQRLINIANGMVVVCREFLGPNKSDARWDEACTRMSISRTIEGVQRLQVRTGEVSDGR